MDKDINSQVSGLGLSVVKNMADNLDIKIGFISKYGEGSKFYLRIYNENSINFKHTSRSPTIKDSEISKNN
jgi:hypothetical protein